jgi:hypothetical protein
VGGKKEQAMKFATISKTVVLGFALLLAASAFAGTKGTLQLTVPAVVNGTQLKAGDYKVDWEGSGPNVEVTILKGKTVVAKVPAHMVNLNSPAEYDTAVIKKAEDGTSTLTGMRFGGKKFALELGESISQLQSGSSK